ncbi:MAG: hypothetical protein OHK93_002513 [Ramalina farinacea]|uniref:Uncharacterized protein n=1 Tax=Ramalina farinacea TaxID=258253 RepID=A0AA43QTA9_9LECA|nr:hypothetical protein [Ramalina farinacea]
MPASVACRSYFIFHFLRTAVALVARSQQDNITLAALQSNFTSPNTLVPCCAGLKGGYAFGGFYDKGHELTQPNDKYLREMIDLLVPFEDTRTERGTKALAYFEDLGNVGVLLDWVMDPPDSETLTYTQCREALGYLVEIIEDDIFEPDSVKSPVLLDISVGKDTKIIVNVVEEAGRVYRAHAGNNLELAFDLFQTRPINRVGTLASLAEAKAGYRRYSPAATVPESFTQSIFHGGVRYKIWMELDDGQQQWPYFTFTDLIAVVGKVQGILEGTAAPSADSWDALYASITVSENDIGVGFVRVEPIDPGTDLLTSGNSTGPAISLFRNSSVVSPVDVT